MNSTRCSKATTALLCIAVLVATAGTVSAFTVSSEGIPTESQVGEQVTASYTIDDPFTDVPNEWTLDARTDLENVSWTVTVKRAGSHVSQETYGTQAFEQDLDIDNNGDEVRIDLVGTTPEVENHTYSPEETYTVASLTRITGNNAEQFENSTAHHYTEESVEARTAIEDAEAAIDRAGGHDDAERLLERARSAYDAENFDNAVGLAEDARQQADSAHRSQQVRNAAFMGGGVLLVLGLIGGGVYYYKSQQDDYSRL